MVPENFSEAENTEQKIHLSKVLSPPLDSEDISASPVSLRLVPTDENHIKLEIYEKDQLLSAFRLLDQEKALLPTDENSPKGLQALTLLFKNYKGRPLDHSSQNDLILWVLEQKLESSAVFREVFLATKNKILIDQEVSDVELVDFNFEPSVPYEERLKDYQNFLSLTDAVFFRFQDNKFVSLSSVLKSPLALFLPPEIFSREPSFDSNWEEQFLREEAYVTSYEKRVVNNLIAHWAKKVKTQEIDLFLIEKPYRDMGLHYDFLEGFQVSPKIEQVFLKDFLFEDAELSLEEQTLKLKLKYEIDLKKARMMGSVFHLKDEKSLYITKEDEVRQKIKETFSADHLRFELKSLAFSVASSPAKSSVSYQESFFSHPKQILKKLKEVLPFDYRESYEIQEHRVSSLEVYFSNVEKEKFTVSVPEIWKGDVGEQMIERFAHFISGIKNGAAHFLDQEAVHIAINGSKRINELKLLQSSGFFIYLLSRSLKKKSFLWDKTTASVFSRVLEQRFEECSEAVSDHFFEFINEVIDKITDQEFYKFFTLSEKGIEEIRYREALVNLLTPFLKDLRETYGGDLFSKEEIKGLDFEIEMGADKNLRIHLFTPFALSIKNYIYKNQCFFNQESLYVLPDKAFKAEINVLDHPGKDGGKDWFDLDPKYYFDGKEITEEEAKAFQVNSVIKYDGKLYFVSPQNQPDLKLLNFLWESQNLNSKKSKKDTKKETKFYRSFVLDILALKNSGLPVHGGEKWQKIVKEYESLEEKEDLKLKDFQGELKPFQQKGVMWITQLYRLGLGGVLADDMGLGKTVQILAFLNHLEKIKKGRKHLVVVPTSLVHNWKSEIEKFTPQFEILVYKTGKEEELQNFKEGLVIVTYGLLSERRALFDEIKFDVVVLDEAQQIKNINSKRSQASRGLKAEIKLCLTGTPMENHYGEFYSLIDTSLPGALGRYDDFLKIYGPKKVNVGQVGEAEISYLKSKTKPLVLRRTKDEVLQDLPEKTESLIKIDFDEEQKEIYKNVALLWNSKVQSSVKGKGEARSQIQMFAALMKLRQICSCPDIVVGAKYNKLSPKIKLVLDQVEELIEAQKSVIVFTNFVTSLNTIKNHLISRGLPTLSITGKDGQAKREKTLNEFNQEGNKALIMTLKTGGVGLNLTKANYIIHVEPWWNPAAENQGTDRAHRIGQKQSVHVYRYIMANSIEEKIQNLKDLKQEAFNTLLTENEGEEIKSSFSSSSLSQKDFEYLLS